MFYRDPLYGEWKLPDYIERLWQTQEMVRARGITQAVLPNSFSPHGPLPSRAHHGLGVCRLAREVLVHNLAALLSFYKILPIASLYHDAGNPPFSHSSEYFMKDILKKDGEQFLEDVLRGSESERLIRECGSSSRQIVGWVCGQMRPHSDVLNGSLDIDNLDNVARYNLYACAGAEPYDALFIARSFRFLRGGWILADDCYDDVQKWKLARTAVYRQVYGASHLAAYTMLFRAMELAFAQGCITRRFFFFNNAEAVEYLFSVCGDGVSRLVERAMRHEWYEEVFSVEMTSPSEKLHAHVSDWHNRGTLADRISKHLGVIREDVCVYAGRGRDRRKITIPLLSKSGAIKRDWDNADDRQTYRLKVYAAPDAAGEKEKISEFMRHEVQ